MAKIQLQWFPAPPPPELPVTQVSGFCFDQDGRLLITLENGEYRIPGGKPERGETHETTLKREVLEEVQCEIADLKYLGYQLVNSDREKFSGAAYAQLRFAARITTQYPRAIDVSTGQLIGCHFVAPGAALRLLNWGENGSLQVSSACHAMRVHLERFPGSTPTPHSGGACPLHLRHATVSAHSTRQICGGRAATNLGNAVEDETTRHDSR